MVKRYVLLGCAAVLAALGTTSCAALVGLDQPYTETGSGGAGAAGGSGGSGAGSQSGGSGGTSGCVTAGVPDPPAVADDGGDIDFVTALRTINLDEKASDVTLGLDLDGLCTCEANAPPSCTPLVELVCDGPGGIDNAVGILFAGVYDLSSGAITSGQISAAANKGQWTNLMRVRGYNGEPDDAKVEVMLYMTQGVSAGMPEPLWDGNDAWPVDDTSLASAPDLDSAMIQSDDAYVSGGVLVARIANERIRIRSTFMKMDLDLVDVTVRANLEGSAAGYKLTDGVVAGRWPLTSAFPNLASIRYIGDQKLCTGDSDYVAVKLTICGNADLRQDGASGACDMLSFGATFTADPAKLGGVVPAPGPPAEPCDPSEDPSTDSCE